MEIASASLTTVRDTFTIGIALLASLPTLVKLGSSRGCWTGANRLTGFPIAVATLLFLLGRTRISNAAASEGPTKLSMSADDFDVRAAFT